MAQPGDFLDRLRRELEMLTGLARDAGEALADQVQEANRALQGHSENPPNPGRWRRLDPNEALRLYEQGWSNAQIAERFGVTPLRVSIVLRSLGVRRPRGARPDPRVAVRREEVLRLHQQGLAPRDIAPQVGVTAGRVAVILREMGVEPHLVASPWELEVAQRRERVLEAHYQGLGPMEIAENEGLHHVTVYRILQRAGLRPNTGRRAQEARERHEEILRLHFQGLGNREIARRFGISDAAVSVHLAETRPPAPPIELDLELRAYELLPQVESLRWDISDENVRLTEIALMNLSEEAGGYIARLGRYGEESRWRAAFVRERLRRALADIATLRGCLAQLEYARGLGLERVIDQAEGCVERAIQLVRECCPRPPRPSPLGVRAPIPGLAEEE